MSLIFLVTPSPQKLAIIEGRVKMVSSELVKTEDELRELYHFLLMRAREEEANGSSHTGRVYREYAVTVSQQLERGRETRI